jgi:hypothetical protein
MNAQIIIDTALLCFMLFGFGIATACAAIIHRAWREAQRVARRATLRRTKIKYR